MAQKDFLFTSESVTEGHPDKVADQISDAVLDTLLAQDKKSRVACETLVTTGMVIVAGEVTTTATIDVQDVVRRTIASIGYTHPNMGFEAHSCGVMVTLGRQSPDISQGVTEGEGLFKEQGAGDQGIMFGYACRETPELMPMPIQYAHEIARRLAAVRKDETVPFLRPDGKSQVTVAYENGKPKFIDTIVVSTQHDPGIPHSRISEAVIEEVVKKVLPAQLLTKDTRYFINPTGNFVVGGPMGDCGLTGRKIIVDTYGGYAPHGGGAFSGKDPSKVDRSACYMARYIAKNIVAANLAERCMIQVAYAIGYAEPVSLLVETYGTETVANDKLVKAVRELFPLKPAGLIEHLNLLRPIYQKTAAYGHFGREGSEFSWEKTDRVEALKAFFK